MVTTSQGDGKPATGLTRTRAPAGKEDSAWQGQTTLPEAPTLCRCMGNILQDGMTNLKDLKSPSLPRFARIQLLSTRHGPTMLKRNFYLKTLSGWAPLQGLHKD